MKKNFIIFIITFIALVTYGCEDDALLSPQSEAEEDGGSYGNLSLAEPDDDEPLKNPKTF